MALLPGPRATVILRDRLMTALQQKETTSWNHPKSKMQKDLLLALGKIDFVDSVEAALVSTSESQTETPKSQREYHSFAAVRWLPGADLPGQQLEEHLIEFTISKPSRSEKRKLLPNPKLTGPGVALS